MTSQSSGGLTNVWSATALLDVRTPLSIDRYDGMGYRTRSECTGSMPLCEVLVSHNGCCCCCWNTYSW